MASYNKVIMMGNLTRDPEYKQLSTGQSLCRLGLASNRQFRNRQTDTMIQEVCFVDVDVWGSQAESCRQYLQKGRAVLVEGRLKYETWQDNNGQNRSKHIIVADRVIFLSSAQSQDMDKSEYGKIERKSEENQQLEKELLDQIEDIKSRSSDVKPAKKAAVTKKVEEESKEKEDTKDSEDAIFKDEPPFQDDLPF